MNAGTGCDFFLTAFVGYFLFASLDILSIPLCPSLCILTLSFLPEIIHFFNLSHPFSAYKNLPFYTTPQSSFLFARWDPAIFMNY